jgi:hypothetical protein
VKTLEPGVHYFGTQGEILIVLRSFTLNNFFFPLLNWYSTREPSDQEINEIGKLQGKFYSDK